MGLSGFLVQLHENKGWGEENRVFHSSTELLLGLRGQCSNTSDEVYLPLGVQFLRLFPKSFGWNAGPIRQPPGCVRRHREPRDFRAAGLGGQRAMFFYNSILLKDGVPSHPLELPGSFCCVWQQFSVHLVKIAFLFIVW